MMNSQVPQQYRQASLFVGNLSPEVTDQELYHTFEKAFESQSKSNGPHVLSVRVCRDAITRRSLGYGYVNFRDYEDAEKALLILNYIPIGQSKRPCHIMWSQRDPSLRKSGLGNVIVKNLDKSIDSKTLHDTFSQFGDIVSCRVMYDEEGNSKGFGFVQFNTEEEAKKALESANNTKFQGTSNEISVLKYKPIKELVQKIDEYKRNFVNVYIKNIPPTMTDDEFRKLFEQYGIVTSVAIPKDETGKHRGFGYVCFKQHESAQEAIEKLNGTILPGAEEALFLARHQKKSEREEEKRRYREQKKKEHYQRMQSVNLYVKNIDESWTEEIMKEKFKQFGEVKSCKIMKDSRDISRGFGFVCFSAPEEASKAINEMHGKIISIKPLYVSYHQTKEIRRQHLEGQRMRAFFPPMTPYPYQAPFYPGPRPMRPMGYPPYAGAVPYSYNQPRSSPSRAAATGRAISSQPPRGQQQPPLRGQQQPPPQQQPNSPMTRGMNGRPMQPQKSAQYKFNSNAKNANVDPQKIKSDIGDSIYYKIYSDPAIKDYASKVTGMLMEMELDELQALYNSTQGALEAKISEAIQLILVSQKA